MIEGIFMENYFISFNNDMPKYLQITKHIKKLIEDEEIEDGSKLPTIRALSDYLGVNKVTVINAYNMLNAEGFAFKKMGSGTYVKKKDVARKFKKVYSDTFKKISGEEINKYIDFTGETACGDFFPVEEFKKVLNEVLERDGANALIYQETFGYRGLRQSISKTFWKGEKDPEDILIVTGAQQGIDIASKALININDCVIIEKPTYSGAISVFKGRRANIFEVPLEHDGIDIEKFENILKKNKIKCFYTMSYFQNPTGISCSLEKKKKILHLAEKYNFYIIEDDYLSELIYNDSIGYNSYKSLDINDRVIYIKSFSKIFLPGIRIGYLIPPKRFLDNILNAKINTDIATSNLMQRALQLYMDKGFWKEHIKKLNAVYADRYTFMKKSIQEILKAKVTYIEPGGGVNFYFQLSENIEINSVELFYNCKEEMVLLVPGVLFYKNFNEGTRFFRLGFSQTSNEKIINGLEVINGFLE